MNQVASQRTIYKDSQQLAPILKVFISIAAISFMISAVYCLSAYYVFHRHYPYNWPLFYRNLEFTDFTIYADKFPFFHQAAFFSVGYPFTYPAPMAVLYKAIFLASPQHPLRVFFFIAILAFLVPALLWGRALLRVGLKTTSTCLLVGVVFITSWPAALLLDRANVEIFVWIALVIAVWAYATGREWIAASFFAVAASLKLFPFVFLTLFLSRRGLPKLVWGIVVFAFVTVFSLVLLGPTVPIAYHGISAGLARFHDDYMVVYSKDLTGLDHSLMGLIKTAIVGVQRKNYQAHLRSAANLYIPTMALLGVVLYFTRIRRMPLLNQLMAFSVVSILFTPFSGDGTLIHLYYSFVLCCFLAFDAFRKQLRIPGLRTAIISYAYLLSYQSFWIFDDRRVEAQFKCLVLVVLLYCALKYPFSQSLRSGALPVYLSRPDASLVLSTICVQREEKAA